MRPYLPACLPACYGLQYEVMYKRSIESPAEFWADIADGFHWERKVRGGRGPLFPRAQHAGEGGAHCGIWLVVLGCSGILHIIYLL